VNYSKTTHINKKIMTNRLAKPVLSSLIFASLTGAAIEVGAYEAGDIILRVGPTLVQPDDSSGDLFADNLGNLTSALGTKTGVGVDSNTQAGITATYMMSDKWGIELLAATPFEHDISAKGTGALGVTSVGDTKHLPPTLSMLYFPAASSSPFQPFIGIGINYTIFFDESASSNFESVFGDSSLSLDDSWGISGRIGFDYNFSNNWGFTASAWWIDIDTEGMVKSPSGVGLGVTEINVDAQIDPVVYQLGLNYKF